MLTPLTAISPVDGRYRNKTEKLADYFSEQALIRYRIRVEVEYFIALCELPLPQLTGIDRSKFAALRALYLDFSDADARRVKEIESVTNHDVKAIEYIIKEKMDTLGLEAYKEFVHFGLTSQDINNTAIPLSLREAISLLRGNLRTKYHRHLQRLRLQTMGEALHPRNRQPRRLAQGVATGEIENLATPTISKNATGICVNEVLRGGSTRWSADLGARFLRHKCDSGWKNGLRY